MSGEIGFSGEGETSKAAFLVCKHCKGKEFTVITILDHPTELGKFEMKGKFDVTALECVSCGEQCFPSGKEIRI